MKKPVALFIIIVHVVCRYLSFKAVFLNCFAPNVSVSNNYRKIYSCLKLLKSHLNQCLILVNGQFSGFCLSMINVISNTPPCSAWQDKFRSFFRQIQ